MAVRAKIAPTEPIQGRQDKTEQRPWLRTAGERYALLVSWAVLVAIFGVVEPNTFLVWSNFGPMFGSQAVLVVLTLGMLLVLRVGEFDMSVASVLLMSSMLLGVLQAQDHMALGLVLLIALGMGLLTGLVNGAFVVGLGIDSFIVTLASGTVLQGLVLWMSGSQTFSGISTGLVSAVAGTDVLGVPVEFFYGLGGTVLIWIVFRHLPIGLKMLFVGRGREVARLSGVNVGRVKLGAFVCAGGISAIAGILYAGTTGGADPTSGLSYLLPVFASAFLGATAIEPGTFNAWGALIGVYFVETGINALALLGINTFVQDLFDGGVLLVAVAASQLIRRRQTMKIS